MSYERQRVWGWLAWGNFFFGGMGGGMYLVFYILKMAGLIGRPDPFLALLPPFFVIGGLACVAMELGKKLRAANVLLNLKRSWMSREALAAAIFIPSSVVGGIMGSELFLALAFAFALIFTISQGYILSAAKGVPAWDTPITPLLIFLSSASAGMGAFMLTNFLSISPITKEIWPAAALTAGLLSLVALVYVTWPGASRAFREALLLEKNMPRFIANVFLGGLLPLALAFFAGTAGAFTDNIVLSVSALLVAGSADLKYILLIRLSYLIPVTPAEAV